MVNKFFYIRGGSETYYFTLKSMLQERGHELIDFSMADGQNFPSPYSEYFVANQDYHQEHGVTDKLRMAGKFMYSLEARRKIQRLIESEKPDLIHLHMFHHQITPSILDVVQDIPCLYTAHDLQLVCPNYQMLRQGRTCEECLHGNGFPCVRHRCVMDSRSKSALSALEYTVHRKRNPYRKINFFLAPSLFYRQMFEKAGFPKEKLIYLPNFLPEAQDAREAPPDHKGYLLYVGRLSHEKGLHTLLNAFNGLEAELHIVGSGPEEKWLQKQVRERDLRRVRLYGFLHDEALAEQIAHAKAVVLPSEWYENCPYSAIEALRCGRPLIGSRIGGIPEMIDGNGFLFEPGSAQALRDCLQRMIAMPLDEWREMRNASVAQFQAKYTLQKHLIIMRQVYAKLGLAL